jgi:hypothetical protein
MGKEKALQKERDKIFFLKFVSLHPFWGEISPYGTLKQ